MTERFQKAKEDALKFLKSADHMLTQTYPLVKDPKLLLAVLNNISITLEHIMSAVLYYDRIYRRIPPFYDNFESKFNIFKMKSAPMNKMTEMVAFVHEINELVSRHKHSPVEFSRKDAFVICDDDYRMRTISVQMLHDYVEKTKRFYSQMEETVRNLDERSFV